MTIDFKTNIKLPYVDTDNAFEMLATVVNNGQTRLSLEVLMDVLIALVSKVEEIDSTVAAIVEALTEEDSEEIAVEKVVETKVEEPVKQETKASQKVKSEEKKVDSEEK